METTLNKAGLYHLNDAGTRYLVRVDGKYPILNITHVIDLNHFANTGEMTNHEQMLSEVRANPLGYMYVPLNVDKSTVKAAKPASNVEYTTEEFDRWKIYVKNWDYGKAISQMLMEKAPQGWSVPQVEIMYKQVKKKLDEQV